MKTLLATDAHISVCNGKYFAPTQISTIFMRYFENFGKLTFCGRITQVEETASLVNISDILEDVVAVHSLGKALLGLYDQKIKLAVQKSDFVICRCGGLISDRAADFARKKGRPYFAEIMSCAWDGLWNHSIIGKLLAPYMFLKMKQTVYNADYALYVTRSFLQKRYPCKNESVAASNVLIEDVDELVLARRLEHIAAMGKKQVTLMTAAAVDVRYKGQRFVIKAIPLLNKAGIRVRYLLVGGGEQTYLKDIAQKCGVADQVEFLGRRPLAEVFELLDIVDVYIQPSLQEGLPRSVIEAMSRGCPVIGAKTAGIPELIEDRFVVRRKSVSDIAETVAALANFSNQEWQDVAKRNFCEARNYEKHILDARRNTYFEKMKDDLQ